jgi:hypothetical protein
VKASYTAEEWDVLRRTPLGAATIVVLSGRSGPIQVIREAGALAGAIREASKSASPLIAALAGDLREGASLQLRETDESGDIIAEERLRRIRADVFRQIGEANTILEAKGDASEAEEYRRWVLDIARRAAEAATEGGFLGFGGTRVTAEETATLTALATALGVSE